MDEQNSGNSKAGLADFLFIGVQKAGSTWIHRNLVSHPEVFLAEGDQDKDVQFFSSFYDRGHEWYERFFCEGAGKKMRGEISTSYFPCTDAPRRIAEYNPNMRLILCLRNPVDRLISNHKHELRLGHISELNFDITDGIRNNPAYIDQSMYGHHLANWFEYFPRDSFHIMIFEEVFANPMKTIQELYGFLDLDSKFVPENIERRVNVARISRSRTLDKMTNNISGLMRSSGLGRLVDLAKSMGIKVLVEKNTADSVDSLMVDDDDRKRLIGIFKGDVQRLSKLLGRDFSMWDR